MRALRQDMVLSDTKNIDRFVYLHCDRARGASTMACEEKEFDTRDHKMGVK